MILIVLAAILVLAIAFYQVIQGLFSSLIMAILTLLCALAAFTYYEPFAEAALYARQPATADAIALITLFVLPLLVLRILADKFISGNVVFGMWINRIGGGVLGLFTGTVLVGVLAIAAQMLPFGKSVLGYVPFDDTLTERNHRLWPFLPDEFVLGMVKTFSVGSMGAGRDFSQTHDDLLKELFCARNKVERRIRVDARSDSLAVVATYEVPDADLRTWATLGETGALAGKTDTQKVYVLRVKVDEYVRGEKGTPLMNWWVLPATHFRLVTANAKSHYPVAYLWRNLPEDRWETTEAALSEHGRQKRPAPEIARLYVGRKQQTDQKALTVDWIYLIDEADQAGLEAKPLKGKPRAYLVFRRVAKVSITKVVQGMPGAEDALKSIMTKARKLPLPATKPATTTPARKPPASAPAKKPPAPKRLPTRSAFLSDPELFDAEMVAESMERASPSTKELTVTQWDGLKKGVKLADVVARYGPPQKTTSKGEHTHAHYDGDKIVLMAKPDGIVFAVKAAVKD